MARYDRDFLVPYLQNICALYMAEKKIKHEISQKTALKIRYEKGRTVQKPEEPFLESSSIGCFGICSLIFALMGAFVVLGVVFLAPTQGVEIKGILVFCIFLGLIGLGVGGYFFWCDVSEVRAIERKNEQKEIKYRKALDEYKRSISEIEEENRINITRIPAIRNQIAQLNIEHRKVCNVLETVYNANVIPLRYRNIYVSVFLFDWFSTSGADDLDVALSMFVLEKIKARLDEIIENQAEIILNQQLQIANQRKDMEDRRKFEDDMRRKLDRLQTTEEENLRYNRMIESNTAVTAYFATAEYLRK